jgi:hypothetical protein
MVEALLTSLLRAPCAVLGLLGAEGQIWGTATANAERQPGGGGGGGWWERRWVG